MRNLQISAALSAALLLSASGIATAGLFDALIERAVKGATEQAVGGAVNNAVAPQQPAPAAYPPQVTQQNGCYYNLPPLPQSAANHVADPDRNGCVDANEMSVYMQMHQQHTANAQPQPAAAPSAASGFFGALVGGVAKQAVGGGGSPYAGMSGQGAAWVAANQAVGAAGAAQAANAGAQQQTTVGVPALPGLTAAESATLANYAQAKQAGMSNQAAALVASNQGAGATAAAQANNAANAPFMGNPPPMRVAAMNNPQNNSGNISGNDDLWEIVSKVEMAGMPMAIPPQTNRVCKPAGQMRNEDKVPMDSSCKMLDSNQSGNTFTYKVACNQQGTSMTGTGDVTTMGADSYHGKFRMQATSSGQAMDMTTNFSGRKVGGCVAGR